MGFRYDSDDSGNWWEFLLTWKWPHEGFTLGYDMIQPEDQPDNGLYYGTILFYLGPLSIIYNFGNHDYE